MRVALNILSATKIYASKKIENLDEKRIVPKMMLRRRLTRNAKIMLYLADKCGFKGGKIVYASAFGELQSTVGITTAILEEESISPTMFQNSVYNAPPSYFSLLYGDTDEIITISSGMKSSDEALKTAALQALISGEQILCVASESIDIPNIEQVNNCVEFLESGAAVVLEIAQLQKGAKEIQKGSLDGLISSIVTLFNVASMYENGVNKIILDL